MHFITYDKGFHTVIDTSQRALLLYDKGVWLEGPQVLPNGDVVVSDVKQNMLLTFHALDSQALPKESSAESNTKSNTESKQANREKHEKHKEGAQAQTGERAQAKEAALPPIRLSTLKPSHFQNGHAIDLQGNLLAASHGRRGIERLENGKWQLLIDSYKGGKLNSPNDLLVDSRGAVWFSDPRFGLKNPLEGYGGEDMQGGDYLYRLDSTGAQEAGDLKGNSQGNLKGDLEAGGTLTRLNTQGLQAPNGLALSPDEKLLYVADSARAYNFDDESLPSQILVYKVNANGTLGAGKVFARIDAGIPDGIKVDAQGNVWSSTARGILIFRPNGKKLGEILFPELVGNFTFSLSRQEKLALQKQGRGDVVRADERGERLFVTSGGKFYALTVKVESGIKRK